METNEMELKEISEQQSNLTKGRMGEESSEKEKILLIKEILIYADEKKIKLPEDIVPRLLKESMTVLKTLKEVNSIHKDIYFNFVVKTNIEDEKLKQQLLDEIIERGEKEENPKRFVQYVNSVIKFNSLGPSKDQLLTYARQMQKVESNSLAINIIKFLQSYRYTNQEILDFLEPFYSNISEKDNLFDLNSKDDGFCYYVINADDNKNMIFDEAEVALRRWFIKKNIPREKFLRYISWAIEKVEIGELLSAYTCNHFLELDIEAEDYDRILTHLCEQSSTFRRNESYILRSGAFEEAIHNKEIDISSFLSFAERSKEKGTTLQLKLFYIFLKYRSNVSLIEYSEKVASVIERVSEKDQKELVNGLFNMNKEWKLKEKNAEGNNEQIELIHLLEFLTQLDEFKLDRLTKILESRITDSFCYINELQSFLEKLTLLDSHALELLQQSINYGSMGYVWSDDKYIYLIYSYLIQKLFTTNQSTKKFEAALQVLNNTKYGKKYEEADVYGIMRKVIDIIFETEFDWQRQNIVDVASDETLPELGSDCYLKAIEHMMNMKQRNQEELPPYFGESYTLYQNQIEELNQMLRNLEPEQPKIKKISE